MKRRVFLKTVGGAASAAALVGPRIFADEPVETVAGLPRRVLGRTGQPPAVKQALGPDGAMETILKAREEGKIKYIGFSAHTTKGALEALNGFKFDTIMFPINFVEYYTRGFGKDVLAKANEQGAG